MKGKGAGFVTELCLDAPAWSLAVFSAASCPPGVLFQRSHGGARPLLHSQLSAGGLRHHPAVLPPGHRATAGGRPGSAGCCSERRHQPPTVPISSPDQGNERARWLVWGPTAEAISCSRSRQSRGPRSQMSDWTCFLLLQ